MGRPRRFTTPVKTATVRSARPSTRVPRRQHRQAAKNRDHLGRHRHAGADALRPTPRSRSRAMPPGHSMEYAALARQGNYLLYATEAAANAVPGRRHVDQMGYWMLNGLEPRTTAPTRRRPDGGVPSPDAWHQAPAAAAGRRWFCPRRPWRLFETLG